MIESPLIKELQAETRQEDILRFLRARFGEVAPAIEKQLRKVRKEKALNELIECAAQCPDLEAFRERLLA